MSICNSHISGQLSLQDSCSPFSLSAKLISLITSGIVLVPNVPFWTNSSATDNIMSLVNRF